MPWAPFGLDTPSVCRDIALSPFLWGLPWRLFDPSVMLKGSWLFVSVSRSSLLGIEAMFLRPNDIFLISLGEKKRTNVYQMQTSTSKALFVSLSQCLKLRVTHASFLACCQQAEKDQGPGKTSLPLCFGPCSISTFANSLLSIHRGEDELKTFSSGLVLDFQSSRLTELSSPWAQPL